MDHLITVPWKAYLKITAESLLAFYISTFCLIMYFVHNGFSSIVLSILMVICYLFVIGVCAKRILEKLALPAIMLVVPTAPLVALILVVSLIPVIEYFL